MTPIPPQAEPLTAEEEASLRVQIVDLARFPAHTTWVNTVAALLASLDAARDQAAAEADRELDVDVLARAMFATHPLLYPQSWPDDDPDDIGPDPATDARAIAAEYRRLIEDPSR